MRRRSYKRQIVFLIIAAAVILAGNAHAQPNVVVVVTDDQRNGTLHPALTPAIWKHVAAKGVVYRNAMIPTSLCCPSRASILTGLFSHTTGVYDNGGGVHGGWPAFHGNGMEDRSIAQALHDVGYRTGLVGKYLNGGPPSPGFVPQGWDVFDVADFQRGGYYGYTLAGVEYGHAPEDYSTDVIRDHALDFIRSTPGGQPLFLYVAPYAPHSGSVAAPRHQGTWAFPRVRRTPRSFRENMNDKPPWLRTLPKRGPRFLRRALETRADSMMAVDEMVAALVGELEATGRMQETLLVFLSDNGILLGEHRVATKAVPYRAATDIPMVARWDGRLPAGSVDSRLVLNVDVAPTVAGAAGIPHLAEGRSLLQPGARRGFLLEAKGRRMYQRWTPAYCGWRTARYAYVRYSGGRFEELYDYKRDPAELRNRADWKTYRGRKAWLRGLAKRACRPAPPGFVWR